MGENRTRSFTPRLSLGISCRIADFITRQHAAIRVVRTTTSRTSGGRSRPLTRGGSFRGMEMPGVPIIPPTGSPNGGEREMRRVSSSYYVLCLSHDPATVVSEHSGAGDATEAIENGYDSHPHCDFLISRVSGAPVEFGCPGIRTPDGGDLACWGHSKIVWVDADWLRLLSMFEPEDPRLHQLKSRPGLRCWSHERLRRLRYELKIG